MRSHESTQGATAPNFENCRKCASAFCGVSAAAPKQASCAASALQCANAKLKKTSKNITKTPCQLECVCCIQASFQEEFSFKYESHQLFHARVIESLSCILMSMSQVTSIMPRIVSNTVMKMTRDLGIRISNKSAIAGMTKNKSKRINADMLLKDLKFPIDPQNKHIMT